MKLTQLKLFAIKLALYSGGLLYIASDLFLWNGPLWSMLHKDKANEPEQQQPTAAIVYGVKITDKQLKRCVAESAALSSAPADESRVLEDVITNTLLCIRTQYNDSSVPSFTDEATNEVSKLASRSKSTEDFEQLLQSQGYSVDSFTHKLVANLRQQHYLDKAIEKKCSISEADINAAMANVWDILYVPTQREVSHIFFSTLHQNPDEVKHKAEEVLAQLTEQSNDTPMEERFAQASLLHSDDAATSKKGGKLGKLPTYPTPALSELELFNESTTPTGIPTLKQSKWGWHIILAGPMEQGHYAEGDEYRESIRTAMLSYLRQQALQDWIKSNKEEAIKKKRIITHGK